MGYLLLNIFCVKYCLACLVAFEYATFELTHS